MSNYVNGRSDGLYNSLIGRSTFVDTNGDKVPDADWSEIIGINDVCSDGDCAYLPGMHVIDGDQLADDVRELVEEAFPNDKTLARLILADPSARQLIVEDAMKERDLT
jgi:hypothetical protein